MQSPSGKALGWAAVLIALLALGVALSGVAMGRHSGTGGPRAYAFVTGPGKVNDKLSKGIKDKNVGVNNGAFCIKGIGFTPKHVEVTASKGADHFPVAILHETLACSGGTAISFGGNLAYPEQFFVALW